MAHIPSPQSSMFKVIQHLNKNLFVAERRRLDKNIAKLIGLNNECAGQPLAGFLYLGEYYTAQGFQTSKGVPKKRIDSSLEEKMEWHLKDAKIINEDEQMISQVIFKLLDPCESLQDMRNTLPDCLATMIPALEGMSREDEVGCSIRNDERAKRQFEDLLPKIEMYSAARLLY